ncbi:hypothetical protein DL93DRAFT_2154927 [Clavulina sp. PMI_390]|nr:hypothetical protein DL93DRAFT_2154927 [Clavulina sp. PMI_390]
MHPSHPPPNFCCQVSATHSNPHSVHHHPHPLANTLRTFWDPVREDAASIAPHSVNLAKGVPSPPEVQDTPATIECHDCSSSFERPSSLAQHVRKHTGEKPATGFTFESMPSPPGTPTHALQLEIDIDGTKLPRSWEACADEPSHRLTPTVVAAPPLILRHPGDPLAPSSVSISEERPILHLTSPMGGIREPEWSLPSPESPTSPLSLDWRVGPKARGATRIRYRTSTADQISHPPSFTVPSDIPATHHRSQPQSPVKIESDDDEIQILDGPPVSSSFRGRNMSGFLSNSQA